MMDQMLKRFSSDTRLADDDDRAVQARISVAVADRDGDVVMADGCDWSDYQKNPVVMLGHDYWSLPVGKCAGLARDKEAITAKTVFASRPSDYPADKEWVPDTLLSLFKQRVLSAFSVGFMPMQMREATARDREAYGEQCRRIISKWKLLEYSVVPIPANQDAVALAVSKGLSADFAQKVLSWTPAQPAVEPKAQPKAPPPQDNPTRRVIFIDITKSVPPPAAITLSASPVALSVAKALGRLYYP
jgi:HK97 family phage prohead protease